MRNRFPAFRELVPVYAVISFLLSGWTIVAFLWKLPSWLLMLNGGEMMVIFSYSMLTNLLESLLVTLFLIVICVVLPSRFLYDDFVARGTILSAGLIGSLMAFLGSYMRFGMERFVYLLVAPLLVLVLTALALVFSARRGVLRSAALWISDRLTVFLFLIVPLTLVLSIYIAFRLIV
jgi:hypothetical protein